MCSTRHSANNARTEVKSDCHFSANSPVGSGQTTLTIPAWTRRFGAGHARHVRHHGCAALQRRTVSCGIGDGVEFRVGCPQEPILSGVEAVVFIRTAPTRRAVPAACTHIEVRAEDNATDAGSGILGHGRERPGDRHVSLVFVLQIPRSGIFDWGSHTGRKFQGYCCHDLGICGDPGAI